MMNASSEAPKVGAPDPELRNSPIFDESGDEFMSPDLELETGMCYFNGTPYPIGQYICSGNDLLHCENRGIWVCEGECEPM